MQILKKEIREGIINTATRLFYDQGFEEASMRQIAGELHMSVSNLYKYFKNKEELFSEIVKDYYNQYLTGFNKFVSHKGEDTFDSQSSSSLAQAIFESIKTNHILFVLLMDGSRGTKYAGFKDEVVTLLQSHIIQGISVSNRQEFVVNILVRNFLNGVVEIARDYRSDKWALNSIGMLVKYHMNGMHSLYKQ